MNATDVIQHQRLASGYVPGKSETFAAGTSPKTAVLQNCTCIRTPGDGRSVGFIDILVGRPEDVPANKTALRSASPPEAVGLGGVQVNDPPLNVAGGGIIVSQGRAKATIRGTLTNPATSVNPAVTWAVVYGASFGPTPIYAGFSNDQLVRFMFTDGGGDSQDVDFDFEIERVIDPALEP